MVELVIQQPHELTLALVRQPLPIPVQVLCCIQHSYADWQVEFAIIGSSHYVCLRHGDEIWQEVLACMAIHPNECSHYYPCKTAQVHRFAETPYQVHLEFSPYPTPPIPDTAEQLIYHFPSVYDQTPLTALYWQKLENRLEWWTVHTYPQPQGEIQVRTFSQFVLVQKGTL
jgi:hypothetical protein